MIENTPDTKQPETIEERFIVQGELTIQVSDSEWQRVRKQLIVTPDVTVKEILEWAKKHKIETVSGISILTADVLGGSRQ